MTPPGEHLRCQPWLATASSPLGDGLLYPSLIRQTGQELQGLENPKNRKRKEEKRWLQLSQNQRSTRPQ